PLRLVVIGFRKFLATHHEMPSAPINLAAHHTSEMEFFYPKGEPTKRSVKETPMYFGKTLHSMEEMRAHFDRIYPERQQELLVKWERAFFNTIFAARLPDTVASQQHLMGLPVLYILAVIGFIGLAIREPRVFSLYLLVLLGTAAVAFMVFTA